MEELRNIYRLYSQLRFEQDEREIKEEPLDKEELLKEINYLKKSEVVNLEEPSLLNDIVAKSNFNYIDEEIEDYYSRLKGAIIGRFIGCTLGVPVEGYSITKMEEVAKETNTPFPPTEYWHDVLNRDGIQYGVDKRSKYTLDNMEYVPVDDDVTYTVLNVLLLEKYGKDYTIDDVGELWKEILPYACTAEDEALKELFKGKEAKEVANDNPYIEWIGAAIRADAFGYVFAGRPSLAALSSYNDAYLTHRRNGIYGEMFLASSIAASFYAKSSLEALKIGSNYIPKNSRLKKHLDWAFNVEVKDFKDARRLLDERFIGMNSVHTINNMCAIVLASRLGEDDFNKTISTIVAMGLDNDCNGASLGSILGAILKIDKIHERWYKNFNDCIHTYIRGYEVLSLDGFIDKTYNLYNMNRKKD